MTRARFIPERMPPPFDYFAAIGVKLTGRGAWRSALCPFHDDTRPSLRVHCEAGAFRCMACNARGRDVLAFERLRTGKTFAQAARDLDAWG